MTEREELPIEDHPDFAPEPGFFDEDDDEPGEDDSAPIPVEDDDADEP